MSEMYVDPQGLDAIAEVAERQHDHLGRVSDYISTTCGRFGAFSGVLNIFEGSYRSAVESALGGMRDGQAIASKVQSTVLDFRGSVLDQDESGYDRFRQLSGGMAGFPPYQAPGAGHAGDPIGAPPAPGQAPDEDDPFGLKGLPPWLGGPAGRIMPGPEGHDVPAWLDPKNAAHDAVLDSLREPGVRERYLEYREQGLSPQDALRSAHDSVDDRASAHVHDVSEQRAAEAHHRAYDEARAGGADHDAAAEAGRDAAARQRHDDAVDHQRRQDVLGAGGTYLGAYDQTRNLVDNVHQIGEHVHQLEETTSDLGDYDDYEHEPRDTSAQDWGTR